MINNAASVTNAPPAAANVATAPLIVKIAPAATKSFNWIDGEALGGSAVYPSVYAVTWYLGGGWYTANSRRGNRRGARGIEDGRNWQQ